MSSKFTNYGINMTAERPRRVKKPKRFAEELSRSMTVQKTEAPKGDKKLYDVEATEMSKVNKRAFFGGNEGPDHNHLLSNAISPNRLRHQYGQIT